MTRVIVHIDAVHLDGFGHDQARAIAEALGHEFAMALGVPHVAERLAHGRDFVPAMPVGAVRIASQATPRQVGGAVARRVAKAVAQ